MSEADSRLRLVSLTEEGARVHDSIQPVVIGINEGMVADLGAEQRAALIRQLSTMLVNLGRL